jgi:hypothetical protein
VHLLEEQTRLPAVGNVGVERKRERLLPVTSSSSCAIGRGGRRAVSFTLTSAPVTLQTACARGARSSQSSRVPHPSASKRLKPIQRSDAGSMNDATAAPIEAPAAGRLGETPEAVHHEEEPRLRFRGGAPRARARSGANRTIPRRSRA